MTNASTFKTLTVGAVGFFASFELRDVHLFAATGLALASLGFVLTRWAFLVIDRFRPKQ